ncbi:MAG: isoleucine--tRNA ligase [Flavobacteriales bacterium]|nr:isoleucine--tRNA ligase [Flavobacteriales bacterium]
MLDKWEAENMFEKSISNRDGAEPFVFYEGPPSANGMPGIHHVMARAIKDIFCRYKTLKGFQVNRKAGWDTHGLPVELSVEKELGITKEDIGTKISIADYNKKCSEAVMKYTEVWNDLTRKIGYWVDMENPYITYETKYIESVWHLLHKLYKKDLIYKGYTIQPYSPAAGTGLSTHELNQPGCYKDVTDTTVAAQFKIVRNEDSEKLFEGDESAYFLAWTTTPWTLPSNTALAVGKNIEYVVIKTYNQYTFEPVKVLCAIDLVGKWFTGNYNGELEMADYTAGDKKIPFQVVGKFKGADLVGIQYEQLMPYTQPHDYPEDAFKVIEGAFVTTSDGTGIVHIAPTFGADDAMVAKIAGIPPMLVMDANENLVPLVDLQGKFIEGMGELSGAYVKNDYYDKGDEPDKSIDVVIAIKLKEENKAFKVEKYVHSYPHCWRTDKPVLYYPLDSWFIKTTAVKEKLIENNKKINWKPESTGSGRFGQWLENLQDWNLSRSRYWGIPIPIWSTEDGEERICIGSLAELKTACEEAVAKGVMDKNPMADFTVDDMSKNNYNGINLHRPYVDDITLVSSTGKPMTRESDLIDVWFDSGAMPYAQWHYPFENKEIFEKNYPADFIAEGVDQTRGWFFTLHAISTLCFGDIAYKNVISNGLVLDKNGIKMSKRLKNATDPFETIEKYGPDATRWYMITNAQPWDNLKFNTDGIEEVKRKFFGTLYNTYSFFTLYANIDSFTFAEEKADHNSLPEIDRWIISELNTLIKDVDFHFGNYDPTRAGRAIQTFVVDRLSNWYVRLCRRRFWKGEYSEDKIAAYQTLYTCLESVAILSSSIAPFYMDQLYIDLNTATGKQQNESVHLADFPICNEELIDTDLEERMSNAQRISSMVLGIRKKENLRVRQPLQKIMVPASSSKFEEQLKAVEELILSEINVKEMEMISPDSDILVKKVKPNFKTLGKKCGKNMKLVAARINEFTNDDIKSIEQNNSYTLALETEEIELTLEDVLITSDDIPGWKIGLDNELTVALDVTLTENLIEEGIAREFVNRIQNLRKENEFAVTDNIVLKILKHDDINSAINNNLKYICAETLSSSLELVNEIDSTSKAKIELEGNIETYIAIEKN